MQFPQKRTEWCDDPEVYARESDYEEARDWYNELYVEHVPAGHNACYFCGRQPEEHPTNSCLKWR